MDKEYTKVVDVELLHAQLKADPAIVTEVTGCSFDSESGKCWIHFASAPSGAEETAAQALITAHNAAANAPAKSVQNAINKAMAFGKKLMVEYGAQNVLAGRTTAEVRQISDKLADLQRIMESGSLYVALAEFDNITPDALVTQQTIDEFKSKIQEYLGI